MFAPEEISARFDFSIPEAKWLSDLTGIKSDLVAVIRVCDRIYRDVARFRLEPGADPVAILEERMISADLACSAIVRFMRTHGTGVRAGIPSVWVDALPADLIEAHSYFKSLRDKFIAHSVNPLEDNQVFAWVKGYGTPSAHVTHVDASPGRYLPGVGDAALLRRLASALLERVAREIETESARLLEIAQSLPMEEIGRRGSEELPIPEPEKHAGSGRQPFNRRGSDDDA